MAVGGLAIGDNRRRDGGVARRRCKASTHGEEEEEVLTAVAAWEEDDGERRRLAVNGRVRGMDEAVLDLARLMVATEWCGGGTSGG